MSQTIADMMKEDRSNGTKKLLLFASVVVYVSMLLYAGVHSWNLLSRGISSEFLIWAVLGIVAMEVSALALPAALHFWFFDFTQRVVGLLFYFVDITLLIANVVISWHLTANDVTTFPTWLQLYMTYMMPAVPIVAGVFWSVLWLLDPAHKERAELEKFAVATRKRMMDQITAETARAEVNDIVNTAAEQVAQQLVAKLVDAYRPVPNGKVKAISGNGHGGPFVPKE